MASKLEEIMQARKHAAKIDAWIDELLTELATPNNPYAKYSSSSTNWSLTSYNKARMLKLRLRSLGFEPELYPIEESSEDEEDSMNSEDDRVITGWCVEIELGEIVHS